MKATWCVFILLATMVTASAGHFRPTPYTAEWLEQGCAVTMTQPAARKGLSDDDKQMSVDVLIWLRAFMSGISMTALLDEPPREVLKTPDAWKVPKDAVPQLYAFIRKHKKSVIPEYPAERLVWAWYVTEHPAATDDQKALGRKLVP